MSAAGITQIILGLFAVHGVSWSFRNKSPNVAFLPASILPLIGAPTWAPVDTWCQFMSAGILLGLTVALVVRKYTQDKASVVPIAVSEAAIVAVYILNLYTDGNDSSGWATHLACASVSAALLCVGWLSLK